VGKFQAALELAFALLCNREGEVPCYECESCRQILSYSHPDFHLVFPVHLEKSHKNSGDSSKLSEEGWKYISSEAQKRIDNPYSAVESRLWHIPVEWIRELNHSIMRGTIQGKTNVAILCGIDIMHQASANAMLKTLEEPPANTVIFLLSQRPHAVLSTIRSRCQTVRFGSISNEDLIPSLSSKSALNPQDPKILYAVQYAGGSYGKAQALIEESIDTYAEQAEYLWGLCVQKASYGKVTKALETIADESLGGGFDYAGAEKIMLSFLHIIRKTFFQNISGKEAYIIKSEKVSFPEVGSFSAGAMDNLYTSCESAISAVRARGNVLLVLITFLITITEILHGEK
jgi:DNA polymerase-3 subunit delta'